MSLSAALSTAVSGLTASQTRAATVANNIANANTDGYVRRTNQLSEVVVAGVGAGVKVTATIRQTSPQLTSERMGLQADFEYASSLSRTAETISRLIGEPGAEAGLFGAYANFESALRDSAASPEAEIMLDEVVSSARRIADEFARLTQEAQSIRSAADAEIGQAVGRVNDALTRLSDINQLGAASLTPDIMDEQQRLIDDINALIPVTAYNDNGVIRLYTESGVSLLSSAEAAKVEFKPAGFVSLDQSLGDGLSGLTANGEDITPTGTGAQAVSGGKISALFETRDEMIPEFVGALDALAIDLVSRFADDSVDPTKAAGAEGLFVTGLSAPPTSGDIGIAARISVNADIDPRQGGDATRLRDGIGATAAGAAGNADQLNRLIDAFTAPRDAPDGLEASGRQGAAGLAASLSSTINYDYQLRSEDALYSGLRFDAARAAELSETAVDTDQELQELLLVEQAYAANAQVVEVISQLMDLLIEIS